MGDTWAYKLSVCNFCQSRHWPRSEELLFFEMAYFE